jgi:hypothetical protein
MFTLHGHMGSPPVFDGVRVAHLFSFLCCVVWYCVLVLFCLFSSCVIVFPMLTVSLDCPFLIVPSDFFNVYLFQKRRFHEIRNLHFYCKIKNTKQKPCTKI